MYLARWVNSCLSISRTYFPVFLKVELFFLGSITFDDLQSNSSALILYLNTKYPRISARDGVNFNWANSSLSVTLQLDSNDYTLDQLIFPVRPLIHRHFTHKISPFTLY